MLRRGAPQAARSAVQRLKTVAHVTLGLFTEPSDGAHSM
jgi:hypothetical protein